MTATYAIRIPIDTNRGRGETRRIGPTRIVFTTAAPFETGDSLRFSMSLRGTTAAALDAFCSGSVNHVAVEGEQFVVEATIDQTRISVAK
jgi:hypothetical protein